MSKIDEAKEPSKEVSSRKRRHHSIKFEVIGSQIQIIGGSIYPKEEGWSFPCPCCSKWLKARLSWDQDACEYDFQILEEVKE